MSQGKLLQFAELAANVALFKNDPDHRKDLVYTLRFLSLPDSEINRFIDWETEANLKMAVSHAISLASYYKD